MADRPPRRADAFFAAVIEHPWLVLAAFALVTLLAASQLPRTRVVTDLRSLIPRDDVYLDDAKVRRAFGLKDYVVIGVVREEGVFHEETLRHVRRLAEEVAGVEGVLKVRSLFSEDNIRDTSAGLRIEPFLAARGRSPFGLRAGLRADLRVARSRRIHRFACDLAP